MGQRLRKIALLALCLAALTCRSSIAADCAKCEPHLQKMQKLQEQRKKTVELLGKNNDYLAVLTAEQASKFLKVKSNITQILLKLEQINVNIAAVEKSITDEGCISCKEGTP